MSGYEIPFHIQEEIMKRLPVKSLIRFKSVSKAWKSLINSPKFVTAHSLLCHTQQQHLLVSYRNPKKTFKCICLEDDDISPQHRSIMTLPPSVEQLAFQNIVGISHGLVCFYCHITNLAVIWNPSIRKSISVAVPCKLLDVHFGFGVCPVTIDPKIVAVKQSLDKSNMEIRYHFEVMVYTLSSGSWRSLSTNLPTKPLRNYWDAVFADGVIYWSGGFPGDNMIISFDVTNESFQMIDLPDSLARHNPLLLHILKLRESLAIFQYDRNIDVYAVWKMEGGVERSFSKIFAIHAPLVGFTNSGVPTVLVTDDEREAKLVVYEPNSEHDIFFNIFRQHGVITLNSYMETLLLLGRSDCESY